MIELIGGPHDGRKPRRNPDGHEVLVGEEGQVRDPARKLGAGERYIEEGVCRYCGVRKGEVPEVRRFVHTSMAKDERCELCGGHPVA